MKRRRYLVMFNEDVCCILWLLKREVEEYRRAGYEVKELR